MPAIARRQLTPLEPLVRAIEGAAPLDGPAKKIAAGVRGAFPTQVKDVISGTWLGHAVHPMLTDVVIGCFLSATLLDVVGGDESGRARQRLIGLGIAAYGPTAMTGIGDWADSEPGNDPVRRAGLVHASTNALALSLYVASLRARRRGRGAAGRRLGFMGASVLMGGGYLGGHLSLTKGVGADQTVFDPGPEEWTAAGPASDLAPRQPKRVVVADTPVLLVRDGEEVLAIHDRCSHRGCSLSQGELEGDEVVCACHGSRFDLRSGAVKGGPATSPQPAFDTREREGTIEIRRSAA